MDPIARFVADAVLGIDTLWGGDVMCPSGTGRFIADSWFSDEPLPPAYKAPAAARVRETGGAFGKNVDRQATYSSVQFLMWYIPFMRARAWPRPRISFF